MLLCLVCLFAFACFFLSSFSHLSLKHVSDVCVLFLFFSHGVDSVRDTLRSSLCLNILPFFWDVVGKIYAESVHVWNAISEAQEGADQGSCFNNFLVHFIEPQS